LFRELWRGEEKRSKKQEGITMQGKGKWSISRLKVRRLKTRVGGTLTPKVESTANENGGKPKIREKFDSADSHRKKWEEDRKGKKKIKKGGATGPFQHPA